MLILASASATRKALLDKAGLHFSVATADIDERAIEAQSLAAGADGRDVALVLARHKAIAVSRHHPGAIVIGADQTLTLGSRILHKPQSRSDALGQLTELAGKTHRLHAAVALVRDEIVLWSDIESAQLSMRHVTQEEREMVLDLEGDAALDSVGGYRLEGPSIRLFETVSGDYFTILGLPLLALLSALRDHAPELLQRQAAT